MGSNRTFAVGYEMFRSILFGRDYLIVYVDTIWLREVVPDCTAITAAVKGSHEPPLVLASAHRMRRKCARFCAVLEHEYVHVNQALLGQFSADEWSGTAKAILSRLFSDMRAEYEANVIELIHWPQFHSHWRDMPFDRWCALRGYSQSLEKLIWNAAAGHIQPRPAIGCLRSIPDALADGFAKMGINPDHAAWFRQAWTQHIRHAFKIVARGTPMAREN